MILRYVVLGDGLLGAAVAAHLDERGSPHSVLGHKAIQSAGGIARAGAAAARAGDVVVNAAAMTGVDWNGRAMPSLAAAHLRCILNIHSSPCLR